MLAGFGSRRELEDEWQLVDLAKAHQHLDLKAETERIAYHMNKPKTT